jgi:hypothetical protein
MNYSWPIGHPRTMKILNPPSPPFSKGGLGGFENHFGHLNLELGNYLGFGIWILEFKLKS